MLSPLPGAYRENENTGFAPLNRVKLRIGKGASIKTAVDLEDIVYCMSLNLFRLRSLVLIVLLKIWMRNLRKYPKFERDGVQKKSYWKGR